MWFVSCTRCQQARNIKSKTYVKLVRIFVESVSVTPLIGRFDDTILAQLNERPLPPIADHVMADEQPRQINKDVRDTSNVPLAKELVKDNVGSTVRDNSRFNAVTRVRKVYRC